MRYILIFGAISTLLHNLDALQCVDDINGMCLTSDFTGWCYHDKGTGEFNCDTLSFCNNQTALQRKRTSGCFRQDAQCCCNQDDMCNYGHIDKENLEEFVQSCENHVEIAFEKTVTYRPCFDPYCYGFVFKSYKGDGRKGLILGCQSGMHYRYAKSKKINDKFGNDTRYKNYEVLTKQARCKQILEGEKAQNGTTRACIDVFYKDGGKDYQGKFCCCKGSSGCNKEVSWVDETKVLKKEMTTDSAKSNVPTKFIISVLILTVLIRY